MISKIDEQMLLRKFKKIIANTKKMTAEAKTILRESEKAQKKKLKNVV
jgi:hypothetical protein